jgi:hypothetical protein
VTGLIDNNYLNRCRVDASGDYTDSGLTWHEDPGFGDLHAVYMEDNTLNYSPIGWNGSDCQRNGRIVVRHNVVTGTSLETHGYQGAGGCRRSEFYRNTMIANGYGTPPLRMRGGPMLIFENTFSGFASGKSIIALDYPRDVNRAVSGGPCDGTNTTIDGNTMGLKGWPCRDQIGTWMDSATGRPHRWRSQSTRASAFWSNAGLADGEIGIAVASQDHIRRCRDVMNTDANNDGTCVEGTANKGVGVGPRSSRPATCTAGVYWWAVDQGGDWDASTADTTDGALDYCSATNTWVNDYYIPARYPHPLQSGN